MKNVLVRLEEYLPRASEAERGAIKWLMQSPESAVDLSIQQLAGRTFTSASTIIRLCPETRIRRIQGISQGVVV